MDDVRERDGHWLSIPYPTADYPPGAPQGEVVGVDLALTDGDADAAIYDFLEWSFSEADEIGLRESTKSLERAVPLLTPAGRAYFEPLLDLLHDVARLRSESPPTSS